MDYPHVFVNQITGWLTGKREVLYLGVQIQQKLEWGVHLFEK